jgi:mono/diheme cytochrome c family protein
MMNREVAAWQGRKVAEWQSTRAAERNRCALCRVAALPFRHSCPLVLLLMAATMLAAGCRGDRSDHPPRQFFPDMEDTPRWNPQAASHFFPDGRTMRPPVEGTVAHSRWAYHEAAVVSEPFNAQREDLLREDDAFYRGKGQDGLDVAQIPIPVTADLILRGQERFNIYCAACHGYKGDGMGMVGVRWTTPVPSFHDARFQDPQDEVALDGRIFHVAMDGIVRPDGTIAMPSYGHALSARDGWAVVAYIRVLQEAHQGTLEDVPEPRRQELLEQRARDPRPSRPVPGPGQLIPPSPDVPRPHTPGMTPPALTTETPTPIDRSRQNP